ncbi:MAG: VCBS repeat-containing protein [Desulfovibrionaceae bacterium]|nr:VCBS repeat-containing protein [Desulfovibrionaceae bacterium]
MSSIFRIAVLLCALISMGLEAHAAPQTYIVSPFSVNGAGMAYMEKAIASMLTSRLEWKDHFVPASGTIASKVMSASAADNVRAASGADYIIWGNADIQGDNADLDVKMRNSAGKEWRISQKTTVKSMIPALQNVADSIHRNALGKSRNGNASTQKSQVVPQMNDSIIHNENTVQKQVYLNPQFRFQGKEGSRLRSQTLPFAAVGMEIADVNGDGKMEIVLLQERRVFVYTWQNQGAMKLLGEYAFSPNYTPISVRSIDANHDGSSDIVLCTYDENSTEAYSYILSFSGNRFQELAARVPYYLNVVRITPEFIPVLIGQKSDSQYIFSKKGVYEMSLRDGKLAERRRLNLPKGGNVFNMAWIPGKEGFETDKLIMITGEDYLRAYSSRGSQLYQSQDRYSGSAVAIAEQAGMPGLGKETTLIATNYYVPLRMIPADLEKDGEWELLVNRPISAANSVFERYRAFPEGEIHSLFWDGVGLSLQWKTRRIKGTIVDLSLSDPNNDGVQDLVVCINTHPGALGINSRKAIVVLYPLDMTLTDPQTAPELE